MPENAHENSSRCAAATTRPTTTNASLRWLNAAQDLISKSVGQDPAKKQEVVPDNQWPPEDRILMRKWKSSRPVKKTKVRSHVSTFLSEARDAVRFVPCVATSYLVLLLSLYFNGPPPDETFRFHRLLQSVESVELPIDFSPSILEMESLNSYFIIKAADGRRRPICQLPYLPAGISRWRFILVLECRLAFFFPYTEHSSQTLAVLSSVVSGNTTGGAEDGVSS